MLQVSVQREVLLDKKAVTGVEKSARTEVIQPVANVNMPRIRAFMHQQQLQKHCALTQ